MTIYEIITGKILDQLKAGVIPWLKPWTSENTPRNLISKHEYTGINLLLLSNQYTSPYYITLNQIKKAGGTIQESERKKYQMVVYWGAIYKDKAGKTIPAKELKGIDQKDLKRISFLRYTNVWNITQTEGLEKHIPKKEVNTKPVIRPLTKAIEIMRSFPYILPIKQKKNAAYYSVTEDYINLPGIQDFHSVEDMYSTLFHEFIHSTGHESRLKRFDKDTKCVFGNSDYSKEELIAEFGASFLCGIAGIKINIQNTASYIDNWSKALSKDSKLLTTAVSKATKATEYLLANYDNENKPTPPVDDKPTK